MRSMGEQEKKLYQQWDPQNIANFVDSKLSKSEKNEVLTKLWSPQEKEI